MKKTMFKKVLAGIAAVFTLGLCVPTGFTNIITQPSFETVAESGNGWTLDADGVFTVNNNTTINVMPFCDYRSIKKVIIGDNCNIGEEAFNNCKFLESVKIGKGCDIGESAFENCATLTSVEIGEGCTIGKWAFVRCNSIQKVSCIGDKNTVKVDNKNPEIICNKGKWTIITVTLCPKCYGNAIDFKCESCGYIDEAAAQAEIDANEAEIELKENEIKLKENEIKQKESEIKQKENEITQKQERNAYLKSLLNEQEKNTASTFSDGSVLVIVGGSTFLILCGLAAVIIVKRRKKTQ